MQVKWMLTPPGGERRGFVEGREFDWPRQLVSKMEEDYGKGCLIPAGTTAERIERLDASNVKRNGAKLSRQERLREAGMEVELPEPEPEGTEKLPPKRKAKAA